MTVQTTGINNILIQPRPQGFFRFLNINIPP